jgi:hypothetical protein
MGLGLNKRRPRLTGRLMALQKNKNCSAALTLRSLRSTFERVGDDSPPARVWRYLVAGACTLSILAFWLAWRWGYNSDQVLTGLMAKSVLERGERPLFVWTFGYQGILLEVYAIALFFKLFGYGPCVLYTFSAICFACLLVLQGRYTRLTSGRIASLLSIALLGVSSPYFYFYAMRPQPNYTETLLFGLGLMHVAQILTQRHYVERQKSSPATYLWCVLGGFLAGFGLYTYAMIRFFIAATLAYALSLYARALVTTKRHIYWRFAWRSAIGLVVAEVFYLLILFFRGRLAGLVPPQAHVAEVYLMWGLPFVPLSLLCTWDVFRHRLVDIRRLLPGVGVALVAFVVGYAPQLYFSYVLHGTSRARTGIKLNPQAFLQHMQTLREGLLLFFNASDSTAGRLAAAVGCCLAVLYLGYAWYALARFIRGTAPRITVVRVGPLIYLSIIVLPLLGLSEAIFDKLAARYALSLFLLQSSALAAILAWLLSTKSRVKKTLALGALTVVLLNNGLHMGHVLTRPGHEAFCGEAAIAALKQRHIQYGVAWFWYAYAISFYTQESIILDPIEDGYNPHYHAPVAEAPRIAYVDRDSPRMRNFPSQVELWGRTYTQTDAWHGDGVAFVVLQRN